jgi:hypothetical protein
VSRLTKLPCGDEADPEAQEAEEASSPSASGAEGLPGGSALGEVRASLLVTLRRSPMADDAAPMDPDLQAALNQRADEENRFEPTSLVNCQ